MPETSIPVTDEGVVAEFAQLVLGLGHFYNDGPDTLYLTMGSARLCLPPLMTAGFGLTKEGVPTVFVIGPFQQIRC